MSLAQSVTLNLSNEQGDINDIVEVDVKVQGFVNVDNFVLTFVWDPTLLQFVDSANVTTLIPDYFAFNSPNTSTRDNEFRILYDNSSSVDVYTIPESEILITLRFRVVSSASTTTQITLTTGFPRNNFTIDDGSPNGLNVTPTLTGGNVELNGGGGTGGGENNILKVAETTGTVGSQTCVEVIGQNFMDVASISRFRVNFDPSQLTYVGVTNLTTPQSDILINDANAGSGSLIILYDYDNGGRGITSSSISLFALCFEVKGACDQTAAIQIAAETDFSIYDSDGNEIIDYGFEDGAIQISCCTAPSITGTVSNTCFDQQTGSVQLNVSGGATPYTFDWSCAGDVDANTGSISGLGAGNCTVTVTSNDGCTASQNFEIESPSEAISTTAAITHDVDNNSSGAIDLTVSGGWGSYMFDWSDLAGNSYPDIEDLDGLSGGEYTVTVTDALGCVATFGPYIVDGFRVAASSIDPISCFGDNTGAIHIQVFGGSGDFSYSWSCPEGAVDAQGNIAGLTSKECTVTVTDNSNSATTTGTFQIPGPDAPLQVSLLPQCATADQLDGSIEANISGGVQPYSIEWNTDPIQTGTTATDLGVGSYSITISDSLDCVVIGSATVIPCGSTGCFQGMEVITPNGDGLNDAFRISCLSGNEQLTIYTRWGEEVVTYSNYQNQWNGTDKHGDLVDEGTYLWVLKVNNGVTEEIHKGAVSVLYALR